MTPNQVLKQYFGYDDFREGQRKLIDRILAGRDVLGIMPTGAGKSICYQVPALLLKGSAIVISPLISLMKDQVYALNQAGIHAAYINSSLTENQIAKAFDNARRGLYKIIYIAPERLDTPRFFEFVKAADISLVAVDEAHCVSQWGQDFRPGYLNIAPFVDMLPSRPVLCAFTATATSEVKDDIVNILGLREPEVLVTGFDRPNLYFAVKHAKDKQKETLQYVQERKDQCGIIYCATRKNVEEVYELLCENGVAAAKYHAGMSSDERTHSQEDFIYDVKNVMVATNAFGMGIDKSNVRYVLHYNMPQSMENYYQEAGRAGRDGGDAECMLLYAPKDFMTNKYLIENKEARKEMTWEEERAIFERDLKRLQDMTYYCTTRGCLRNYILRYFGNSTDGDCNRCSNCLTEYEKTDVTDIAKKIVNCVYEVRQRFGLNVVIGILRGSKAARILDNGFDQLSTYNTLAAYAESSLRQIIDELLQEEILLQTADQYPILKVGPSLNKLQEETYRVYIKSEVRQSREGRRIKAAAQNVALTDKGQGLFEKLRALRREIAMNEKVPPYIVFSDKTLLDMCVRLPVTTEEMLNVSGVGSLKNDKYGQRFMEVIAEETCGDKAGFSEDIKQADSAEEAAKKKEKAKKSYERKKKEAFTLTKEAAESVECRGECTISEFVGRINELIDKEKMERLFISHVVNWLEEGEYLRRNYRGRIADIVIREKGQMIGLFVERKRSERGTEYDVLMVNEDAQKYLLNKLTEQEI